MIMKIPEMARSSSSAIIYFFLVFPFLIHAHQYCPDLVNYQCPDFNGRSIKYPFTNNSLPDCGFCVLDCNNHTNTTIQCGQQQLSYKTKEIFPNNSTVVLVYPGLFQLITNVCEVHQSDSVTISAPPLTCFKILHLMVFFRCYSGQNAPPPPVNPVTNCGEELVYGPFAADQIPAGIPADCSEIKLPNSTDDNFSIAYKLSDECSLCADDKRQCFDQDSGMYKRPAKRGKHKIQAIILSSGFLLVILAFLILYWRQRKAKQGSSRLDLGIISFKGTRSDLEEATLNGVTVFSYNELEEATNKFDSTKELGEGGFGIVYHGKLRDGREVAVKRLYEKSYKRIQQFKNEIKILTDLRHKNLVTLYGCTSHHSHELLLVYEYIPNGTVSDHLHGNHPNSNFINWSTRMNIAIETAEALCYLHYKDIIHRDIKTNNILLDNNFSVKVADFGLSRLFPQDVTHVSTAPQGTPGYLDPEYHQCYHLTYKSDVYSFGVVLAELLSSLPAVDVGRQRDEINLSKYAINKIQFCAFKELVDPRLGFEVDSKVRRMTTLVAEIAFQCLQQERELRPSMDEVLHGLKWIVSLDYDALEEMEAMKSMKALPSITENDGLKILTISSPGQPRTDSQKENDDVGLLKNAQNQPVSPDSVMSKWSSKSSTPNTSS